MKKKLHKFLVVALLFSSSLFYAQTALPGTIEVENGDLSQNNAHYARNIVGDGNSGTSNIVLGWRKTRIEANPGDGESGAGVNGTIINSVSVAADGNYDFTFTYFKNSADGVISINSTDASGGNSTQLASFTLNRNDATGGGTATTSSYTTQTVTGVALTTGITHITFTNADSKILNLDNVIVTTTLIPLDLPGTIEVEDGDISNNQTSTGTRNVIGSGNGGTDNIISQFRRNSSVDGTIINYVSIAAGDYDFTFTYYKSSNSNTITINSTDASGGNSTQLHSFTLLKNSDTGATTSSYGTQTESVTIPAGVSYITITNPQPAAVDIDNVIVTAPGPIITLLGDAVVDVEVGTSYTDAGATADDGGTDVTASIVTVNPVDINTIGTYTVTYNVTSGGIAADEVVRTVNVNSATVGVTFTSIQNGDWDDPLTWNNPGAGIPTAADDVILNHAVTIPRNYNDINTALAANLTSNGSPAQLIIRENAALTVTGDVTLTRSNDAIAIYGQFAGTKTGTMIFGGTYTATKKTFIRKRLTSDKWHLISSPFNIARVNLTTTSSNTYLRDNGTLLSLASYSDVPGSGNGATANTQYTYFTNGAIANSVRFGNGQGYSISTSNATTPDYYMTGDQHSGPVAYTLSTAGNGFNLVGNPYISYLHGNDGADATNNLLRVNGANGANVLVEDTIWLWDGDNDVWITKNLSDPSFRVAPLQGFFVKASSASAFNFTKAMESHDETDAFLRTSNNRFEIDLSIANNELSRSTSIRYIDNTSTSFDNGYDSSMFGGYTSALEVYTRLVDGNSDNKLAIQSLPNINYEDMVIPIGVTAAANSDVTFTLEALNIPEQYKVYLEDRTQGVFTRLDLVNAEYNATVLDASTEGRFFLHTRVTEVLGLDSELLSSVSIYKTKDLNLRIEGLKPGKVDFRLYNLLGKQIITNSFTAVSGVENIQLPTLATGVYIVQLETENGSINKKVILE